MKPEDLYNAVTELRDDQILEGENRLPGPKSARSRPRGVLAAALAVVVLAAALVVPRYLRDRETAAPETTVSNHESELTAESVGETAEDPGAPAQSYSLAAAILPRMAPFADESRYWRDGQYDYEAYRADLAAWTESRSALRSDVDYTQGLDAYLRAMVPILLEGAEEENRVCSPLNIYSALAMLTETTAGQSRRELLSLLNAPNIETLRARANALWRANYSDDGRLTSLLAASLWLRDDMSYREDTVGILASDYYASVFSGPMGEPDYTAALRRWMNEQTRNLLTDQIDGMELSADTVAALITTVYFQAAWEECFYLTEPGVFRGPAGEEELRFLKRSMFETTLYTGKGFRAAGLSLYGGGDVWFLLPDEGLTPAELLKRKGTLSFLLGPEGRGSTDGRLVLLDLAVPKFDVSAHTDLIEKLKSLGVRSIFDEERSDFTPLTGSTENPITVSRAEHGARVSVDEDGVAGAAYTIIAATKAGLPEELERAELTLDRPFLFVVTNEQGLPLFVGVVNEPAQ